MFDDGFIYDTPEVARRIEEAKAAGGTEEEIEERISGVLFWAAGLFSNDLVKRLKKLSAGMLAGRRSIDKGFRRRLRKKWGRAFDSLYVVLEASGESGGEFNAYYQEEASKENDMKFDALRRLHARACLVGHEIICLMEGGFASGAMARWRTLHEIAVVAIFLVGHEQEVAERYLLHDRIESRKAARQLQEHYEKYSMPTIPQSEMDNYENLYNALCGRFGAEYGGDWGWAAKALGSKKPGFYDIEKAVKLDNMRVYFKLACHSNHAGSKGTHFDLGKGLVPVGSDLLLAGASDAGFVSPGHNTAVSLYQVTAALLSHKANLVALAAVDAIKQLVDEAHREFDAANANMERLAKLKHQEMESRAKYASPIPRWFWPSSLVHGIRRSLERYCGIS